MNGDTAMEIAQVFIVSGKKIEAIKILRRETNMGLLQAKDYLERFGIVDTLFKQLCDDFVHNKHDLLIVARQDLVRLQAYILDLEQQIEMESEAEMKDEYVSFTQVGTGATCRIPASEVAAFDNSSIICSE